MSKMQGKALWYVGPGRAELREEKIAASKPGEVRVRSLFGAISRGTERLVRAGRVPASEYDRMRAPFMGGAFPFPVKYGYATVGQVEAGPTELKGRVVFSLHPHQSLFTVPVDAVFAIPVKKASLRRGFRFLWQPNAERPRLSLGCQGLPVPLAERQRAGRQMTREPRMSCSSAIMSPDASSSRTPRSRLRALLRNRGFASDLPRTQALWSTPRVARSEWS